MLMCVQVVGVYGSIYKWVCHMSLYLHELVYCVCFLDRLCGFLSLCEFVVVD